MSEPKGFSWGSVPRRGARGRRIRVVLLKGAVAVEFQMAVAVGDYPVAPELVALAVDQGRAVVHDVALVA